jgi:MoaA/NifB/PqqE/SkfB family radical SAM enzyme
MFGIPPAKTRLPLAKPSTLHLEITSECNLRCKQCYLWREKDHAENLSTAEKLALIEDYGGWEGQGGSLILTGGEPFRKAEETLALCKVARRYGVKTLVASNGTMIEPHHFESIFTRGPHFLMLSIDAPRAEVHDWIRGRPGTFTKVTQTLRALSQYRETRHPESDIYFLVNMIVCKATLPLISEHIDFIRSLGADGITFGALTKTILNTGPADTFFESQRALDLNLLDQSIDLILSQQAKKDPTFEIVGSEIDFRWMQEYFRNPSAETAESTCDSIYRNLMVNKQGDVSLCHYEWEHFGHSIGNVRNSSLRELWVAHGTNGIREQMHGCRKSCGMMHCHRDGVEVQ